MKTLEDVKRDMSELYEEVKTGKTELKVAGELSNIAGKFLKAAQIELATDIFLAREPLTPSAQPGIAAPARRLGSK